MKRTTHRLLFLAFILTLVGLSCASPPPPAPPGPGKKAVDPVPGFLSPGSLAIDGTGRLYVADNGIGRIVRIDGIEGTGFVAFGKKGFGGVGSFQNFESEIAMDAAGRLYLADPKASRLVRFDDMAGTGWTELDTSKMGLPVPWGVAVDGSGRIYIGDLYSCRIARVDSMAGDGLVLFGEKGSGEGRFQGITSLELDASGRIYVTDQLARKVIRIDDMKGTNWTSLAGGDDLGQGGFLEPYRIYIAPDQTIYVTDPSAARIYRFSDMTGKGREVWGWDGSGSRPFQPLGIGQDKLGRIFFVDCQGKRVARMDDMSGGNLVFYQP